MDAGLSIPAKLFGVTQGGQFRLKLRDPLVGLLQFDVFQDFLENVLAALHAGLAVHDNLARDRDDHASSLEDGEHALRGRGRELRHVVGQVEEPLLALDRLHDRVDASLLSLLLGLAVRQGDDIARGLAGVGIPLGGVRHVFLLLL